MTSCHGISGRWRMYLPTALDGVPQSSRARFSDTTTTGLRSYTSVHAIPRPAISLVPAVRKNPGDAYLNNRTGPLSDVGPTWSWARMLPKFTTPRFGPNPSMGLALPNAAGA